MLANRPACFLPKLTQEDQIGFIPSQQAPDFTHKILNLMHMTESSRTPSLLLSLDAEKAFDKIHWGYLRQVLHKFGIQGEICSVILALYTTPLAYVYTEGMFSDSFPIINDTRQGCPPSPLIVALLMEPLTEKNKITSKNLWHSLKDRSHSSSRFADYVILSLSNPTISLPNVHEVLTLFIQI